MSMNVDRLMLRRTELAEGEPDVLRRASWAGILQRYKALADHLRINEFATLPNTTLAIQEKQGRHMASYLVRRFTNHASDPTTPPHEAELSQYTATILRDINREAQQLIPGTHGVTRVRPPGYGKLLTDLREEKGKTQGEVAIKRGTTATNVSDLEREEQSDPELSNIARHFVLGLDISPTDDASIKFAHHIFAVTNGSSDRLPSQEQLQIALEELLYESNIFPDGQLNLGRYLQYLREKGNMSRRDVYEQIGIQKSFFGKCESSIKVPSLFTFLDWMQALGYGTADIEFYNAWAIALTQESQRENLRHHR